MLGHIVPHLIGPDFPSIETRQLGRGFQIGVFRPIRVDRLEHLKIETSLIDERFVSVMGECVIVTLKVLRLYSK